MKTGEGENPTCGERVEQIRHICFPMSPASRRCAVPLFTLLALAAGAAAQTGIEATTVPVRQPFADSEGQTTLGEGGTWELMAAEDTPGDDILVFTRMTFTGNRVRTTSIYLDADDAELSARVSDDAYAQANGQLLVRANGSTTVLDVSRELDAVGADALVVHDVLSGVTLRLHPADPADALDPALVGTWAGQGEGHGWTFRFEPDGTSYVRRDDQGRDHFEPYTVAGPYLLVDEDTYLFNFSGERLILSREGQTTELSRAAPGSVPAAPAAPLTD